MTGLLWTGEYLLVFYDLKSFYRLFSLLRILTTDLLLPEDLFAGIQAIEDIFSGIRWPWDLLTVFYGLNTCYKSFIARRPLQVFYVPKTFYWSSITLL